MIDGIIENDLVFASTVHFALFSFGIEEEQKR
jgi:hypothetical protein